MKNHVSFILLALVSGASLNVQADALTERLNVYKAEASQAFDAQRGAAMWTEEHVAEDGKKRSCTTCHGRDLKKSGKHARTGKVIDPLAPSVNPERLTKSRKIRKWFKRNCKWVLGRECTAQEKGDFLTYISRQ